MIGLLIFKLVTLGAQTAATQANFNITGNNSNYSASFASYLAQVGAGGLDYGQVVFKVLQMMELI